jgi:hypothetical protein
VTQEQVTRTDEEWNKANDATAVPARLPAADYSAAVRAVASGS